MRNKAARPIKLRAFNALCATLLFASVVYIIFMDFHAVAIAALAFAIAGAATPVALSGEGALEVVLGTFEAIIDGIMAIAEGIASAISGLLG